MLYIDRNECLIKPDWTRCLLKVKIAKFVSMKKKHTIIIIILCVATILHNALKYYFHF